VEKIAREKNAVLHRIDAFQYPSLADELVALKILGRDNEIIPNQVHKSGILIVDVDTLLDAVNAVKNGVSVISKVITATGPKGAKTLKARIGTPISEIIDAIGEKSEWGKVVLGGPLLGRAAHALDLPLTKDIRGLTLQTSEEVSLATDRQCLSCGLCSMACPMRLTPGMLSRYCEYGHWDKAEQARLFTCIECGCCAYVCPAGRSMVQLFSHGKKEIRAARQEVGQ
jgi:electron transport complex protein RnfC